MNFESGDNEAVDKVSSAKKICYGMQSEDRKVRKQTYIALKKYLSDENVEFSAEDLRNVFSETHMYTLNGLRDKTEAVREQAIKFITYLVIEKLPLNDYYLTYIFPVLVERIGSVEIVEESEEIRLQLVQLLQAIVVKYSNTVQLKPFLNDCVTILAESVKDKYPEIKVLSCCTIVELAKALPRDFHMQAENLVKPVLTCFGHQRFKIRVEAIKCVGEIIMHSSHKGLDEVVGPLAEKLFDQIPLVRRTVGQVAARWLLDYRDRYSFFHKILPLLLTGLNDEILETRTEAHELWEKVGLQFQKENEQDLKDQLDYLTQPPEHYLAGYKRPNLGCRVLVQRNVGKLCGAISAELSSWQEDVRVRCSQLLCALALHAESGLTQHLQGLLPAMYSAARDDDVRVVVNIVQASEIMGLFVSFETWSKLLLPLVEDGVHFGHLTVLAGLVKGAPQVKVAKYVPDICRILAEDDVCCSRKKKYQIQLKTCVEVLCEKLETTGDLHQTGYNLFKILVTLIALKDPDNVEINPKLLDNLAKVLNLKTANDLWLKYTGDLLSHINVDPKSWTTVSESSCIFLTILSEANSAFGQNLALIAKILVQALTEEADAESRLKIFWVLSSAFERQDVIFENAVDLTKFLETLIKEVFVPSLVWHAGATAEAIRTMATSCLQHALRGQNRVDLFASGADLRPLFDQLLPLLLSLVEDASYRSRHLALECLVLLKDNCSRKGVWILDDLVKVYPEVLKRLDDPTEQVRLCALRSLGEILQNPPPEFVNDTFRAHHELIIDSLLTHFDDDDPIVQDLVFDVLKVISTFARNELAKKIERHLPLLRNKKGCESVLEYLARLN